MIPRKGGKPLDPAPICLGGDHRAAQTHARKIAAALEQSGWSPGQRYVLRESYRKWLLRAEGRDSYFEKYGTFHRFEGNPPPTTVDLIVERWRRAAPKETKEARAWRLSKGKVRTEIQLQTKQRVLTHRDD